MRVFNYRSICAFSNLQKPKFMILTHGNSFSQYSFLGLNLSDINSSFAAVWTQAQVPPLIAFMKVLNKHRYVIQHAQNNEYTHKQLTSLQKGQKPECVALNKFYQELLELKDKYSALCDCIHSNVNKQSLFLWLEVCQKLDIIESTIWNRIFSIIILNFDSYNFHQQIYIMRYIHRYIKGKFISFTYVPAKFVYRENYLVDITNFRSLFRLFNNWIVKAPNDDPQAKGEFIEKNNELIQKISKIYPINFSQMAISYNKNKIFFENMAKQSTTEMLVELLRYLSLIGMYDKDFYNLVQAKIAQKWSKQKSILNEKGIGRLLAAWANVFHYNEFIYTNIIKPFIQSQIASGSESRHHSVWLYNITASNIRDFHLIQRFVAKILNDLPMSNKYLHIVSHYLAVQQNSKRFDAFPSCSQHPFTQKIVQRNGKSHHNCMNRLKEQAERDKNKVAVTNDAWRQDNASENLWVYIARKAFQTLTKRYPHQDNCFYTNFSFCVFQLDAILMLRGFPITFEWEGSHYKMKEGSEKEGRAQGKKLIKQAILRGYGIHILDISSTNYIERNISSFNDREGGIKYIIDRLEQILKEHA